MFSGNISEKEHTPWLLAALAAPVTHAASNCSWSAVVVVAALCLAVSFGMEKLGIDRHTGRWLGALQWLWMLLVISEFLHWVMYYWKEYQSYHAIPLVLLALAAYSVSKGLGVAAGAARMLGLALAVLLGAVPVFGSREIRLENLTPIWQMQTAHLISVMLIPAMGFGYGNWKGRGKPLAFALAVSAVTAGVLSLQYVRITEAPFYELSRSIRVFGADRRLESLVAAGMTLGYYILATYLLGITAKAWEPGRQRSRSIWISAFFAGLVFLSGMRLNSRLLAVGNMLIWVVLPSLKIIVKKSKIVLDKEDV